VINARVAIIGLLYRPMVVRLGVGVYALALGRRHLSRIGNPDEGQTVADVTLVFYFGCPCSISSALRTRCHSGDRAMLRLRRGAALVLAGIEAAIPDDVEAARQLHMTEL
jgi:hypothetical protein